MQRITTCVIVGTVAGMLLLPVAEAFGQAGAPATIKGSIMSVDLISNPPFLKLADEQGKLITIVLDRTTEVTQQGRMVPLGELKAGQKVEVESVTQDGKQVAKAIEVISRSASAPASAPAAPRKQ